MFHVTSAHSTFPMESQLEEIDQKSIYQTKEWNNLADRILEKIEQKSKKYKRASTESEASVASGGSQEERVRPLIPRRTASLTSMSIPKSPLIDLPPLSLGSLSEDVFLNLGMTDVYR
jgi:hypothetical protein